MGRRGRALYCTLLLKELRYLSLGEDLLLDEEIRDSGIRVLHLVKLETLDEVFRLLYFDPSRGDEFLEKRLFQR